MAQIYPFRALRYSPAAVRLEDVVTQPHGSISPAMQQAYYQRSPFNAVRILCGLPELFDAEGGENVYSRAARDIAAWRKSGVLTQETEPCVFAYAQRFPAQQTGAWIERHSLIALGRLHAYADRVTFPAMRPAPEPARERLKMLSALRAQVGPALMLYSDPAHTVEQILATKTGAPDAEIQDEYGVLHRLWRVSDPASIRLLVTAMADKKLIVAGGQPDYEAALAYAGERASAGAAVGEHRPGDLPRPPFAESAALMAFVNMDAENVAILPTYPVVCGLIGFDPVAFAMAAMEFFTVEALADADAPAYLQQLAETPGAACIAITRAGALLLRAKPQAIAAALPQVGERARAISVTPLHAIVLNRLLGVDEATPAGAATLRRVRDANEAAEQVRQGHADIAFLHPAVSLEQLREVAFAGDVLPPNSIEIYPTILNGLAIHALD